MGAGTIGGPGDQGWTSDPSGSWVDTFWRSTDANAPAANVAGGSPSLPGGSSGESGGVDAAWRDALVFAGSVQAGVPSDASARGAPGTGDGGPTSPSGIAWPALTVPGLGLGGHGDIPLAARLATEAVVTTGGVAMTMAFFAFAKRRRDEEQPAPNGVLRSAASTPPDVTGHAFLADPALLQPAPAPGRDSSVPQSELELPRWRRPSLMEARRADPTRGSLHETRNLTFERGAVGPVEGYERRLLRYRLVSLLDAPDEVRGREVGVLDQGDEVQLLQRSGAYWLVLAPDGSRGWLHRMTLGATVTPAGESASGFAAQDEDVLMGDVRHEGSWVPVGS